MLAAVKKLKVVFILILVFLLGISLFINLRGLQQNFLFADEAIYFALTQSLAQDFDLEYTKEDLIRYFRELESEPAGIFLKKGKDEKIFFAKSFAYPLFAAPLVRVFGLNGFFVFHSLLLFLLILMGYAFLARANKPLFSLVSILTFLLASIACVYYFWISPDFFNLFLVFTVLFFWLFKLHAVKEGAPEEKSGKIHKFLLSDWSDYLAAFLVGIAVFSKPPNIVLMGPIVLHTFIQKKYLKAAFIILIFLVTSGIFWGINHQVTGDWNYQGGERKEFFGPYPLEKEHLTFDSIKKNVAVMTSEGYVKKHILPLNLAFYNLFYYFFGRFTGIIWYFFPAVLALVIFFIRKKSLYQWFILLALAGEILIYIVMMPDNYGGGGGALANRYFLNIYPLFFFLPGQKRSGRELFACWVMAALFLGPILTNPIRHSHFPATHAKRFPFKILPVEMTLSNNFPTNTDPRARFEVGPEDRRGRLHFLDDNFHPRHPGEPGIWTRGPRTAEIILKTYYPVKEIVFHLHNNPRRRNTIFVRVGGEKKKITLGPKQNGTLTFTPKKAFRMGKYIHLYRIKVKAEKGSIPYLEQRKSDERRYLGVRFYPEFFREE